ncbi:MAG: RluA family pseudouridine synthase [Alphaproteobacteria bacterium]|jgi:23S rRNA pseudouridine1911/1915/1917 synthase|nr:RluA family pseudouridine synthase [Alphaproteobacteria bacterium]
METSSLIQLTAPPEANGTRLDRYLAEASEQPGLSRSRIKALITDGQLKCNGAVLTDPAAKVRGGADYQLFLPAPKPAEPQAEAIALDILYEDAHLIVLNKPAGMVVHPAPGAESGTLVNALIAHCGDSLSGIGGVLRPGIVHRLDKDTSGVMLAAKSERAHQRLSEMFAAHDLDRVYQGLVWGLPAAREGLIDEKLGRHRQDRKRQTVTQDGRPARTHYRILRDLPPFGGLAECRLETGRTHQIRVHMAHIGHGLIGDPIYGRPPRAGQMPDRVSREALAILRAFPRQALHAAQLGFRHPVTGEKLAFETALPADIRQLIDRIEQAIAARAGGDLLP